MRKLLLEVVQVDHNSQRYETAGDWWYDEDGVLRIKVSDTGRWTDAMLIAVHEAVEAILCKERGIREEDVTAFDLAFEEARKDGDLSEPGEDLAAPYREEHISADVVERFMALQLGVPWKEYAGRVEELQQEVDLPLFVGVVEGA